MLCTLVVERLAIIIKTTLTHETAEASLAVTVRVAISLTGINCLCFVDLNGPVCAKY